MSQSKTQSVSFEHVQQVASEMLTQGVKPTVRGVRGVTGGRTETVTEHLFNFNKKRDVEVSKLADEIGSSEVGKLIAAEIQTVVDRRSAALTEIKVRQELQIEELIELLKENEAECRQRIEVAEDESAKAIIEANVKIEKAIERAVNAEEASSLAEEQLLTTKNETQNRIASIEQKSQLMVDSAKTEAKSLVEAAKAEAKSLVAAADKQTEKSDVETVSLREQVKLLSIDQAKREIEQEQFKQALQQLEILRLEVAENKTSIVRFESQNSSLNKDVNRLDIELSDTKEQAKQLPKAQAQLVEVQKQISQLQHDLSQSEREKESLSRALAVSDNNHLNKITKK